MSHMYFKAARGVISFVPRSLPSRNDVQGAAFLNPAQAPFSGFSVAQDCACEIISTELSQEIVAQGQCLQCTHTL